MRTRTAIRYSVKTYPICDSPLIGAAQLLTCVQASLISYFQTAARRQPSFVLMCEQKPYLVIPYGFRPGAKANRYHVNIAKYMSFREKLIYLFPNKALTPNSYLGWISTAA